MTCIHCTLIVWSAILVSSFFPVHVLFPPINQLVHPVKWQEGCISAFMVSSATKVLRVFKLHMMP